MPDDLHFNGNTGLQSTIRGLHGTPVAPLPFLKGVVVRSFVLERPQGHVILYNSPGIDAAWAILTDAGRARLQPELDRLPRPDLDALVNRRRVEPDGDAP